MTFDIVDFTANALTGYDFTRKQVLYVLMSRGLECVTDISELTQRDKDLLTADLLRIIYTTASKTSSKSWSHGDASKSVGSQQITDKNHIYEWMIGLYRKWGENPELDSLAGEVQFIDVL